MVIDIGHQELTEMFDDRPPNAIISDPLDDRFSLDITELFQRDLLLRRISNILHNRKKIRTSSIPSISSTSRRSSYCRRARVRVPESSPESASSPTLTSSLSKKFGAWLRLAARIPRRPPRSMRSRWRILASAARRVAAAMGSKSSASFRPESE